MPTENTLDHLPDEILFYIAGKERKVKITDIRESFAISNATLNEILDFLAEFGFVKLDKSRTYVSLSSACKIVFREQD